MPVRIGDAHPVVARHRPPRWSAGGEPARRLTAEELEQQRVEQGMTQALTGLRSCGRPGERGAGPGPAAQRDGRRERHGRFVELLGPTR